MVLTEKAAVAQMRMNDGEWLLKNGPQRFRPSSIGMVREDGGLFIYYQDYAAVIEHFQSILLGIADAEKLTAETPKEQLARCRATANRAIGRLE